MSSVADYDSEPECQASSGLWVTTPAPLCYLPVNNLPAEKVEIVQQPIPSNAVHYIRLQELGLQSMQLGSWIYLALWSCGIFTRMVRAKL